MKKGAKSAQPYKAENTIKFIAPLSSAGSDTILIIPDAIATKHFPESMSEKLKEEVKIEGTVGTLPFQDIVKLNGDKQYTLTLTTLMKKVLGTTDDTTSTPSTTEIPLELTRIEDESETRIPKDFEEILIKHPKAEATWINTTPLARRDWIFWMISGKKAETRNLRITKGLDMLSKGKRRVCCFPGVPWLMKAK